MDRIAYRPRNVRETLVELKDTSELAVDLAYAAALYGHEGLAAEVVELESRADSLQYQAQISLMLAAKRADDAERLVGIVQIVGAAVSITNAAADVASVVLNDVGLPPGVGAALPEAGEVVMHATVAEGADALGRSLGELSLETETGVHVSAVRRGSEWLIAPDEGVTLEAGDIVIGSGPDDGVGEAHERLTGRPRETSAAAASDVPELRRAAETVVRLKDIAELTVGLAYSAVLFDDADLAREVNDLEDESDALAADIETWVIEAGEHVEEPARLRGLLRLASASEAVCDSGRTIADIVLREGDVHPVFRQAVRESDEVITTVTVAPESRLDGETLGALELEENTGMTVMAIDRGDEWVLAPDGDAELRTRDVLIVRGPLEGGQRLREWAGA